MYFKNNITEDELLFVDRSTISRAISDLKGVIAEVLEEFEFVPDLAEEMDGRVGVVDGSLCPCWSWAEAPELRSGKHKTTGHSRQFICDLDVEPGCGGGPSECPRQCLDCGPAPHRLCKQRRLAQTSLAAILPLSSANIDSTSSGCATVAAKELQGLLPAELAGFVGRQGELREVRRGLSASRLVTLTGVGGVGKTRLAIRAAWEMRRAFPDGVCVAELAGLEDGGLVAQAVVTSLGLQDQSTRWTADTLAQRLAARRMLLVLDNCEHLLDACSRLVTKLLERCPDLRVLATSRQPLDIVGERVQPLSTMRLPADDESQSVQALREFEAIKLFEDRAAAAVGGFEIDDHNARVVARLCRHLDGIPLAIELAAAQVRALSPGQLLERLGDQLTLLTSGNRAALPRQQTLRASIDWSFHLCTEQEQALWARASVFAGSFDLQDAEAVCASGDPSEHDVLRAVAGLLDKSVILREERGEVIRYRLLETIRQYGRQLLRAGGVERELQERHRAWYLKLAEDTHHRWFGPTQAQLAERMRLEHANIRAALEFCLAAPGEFHEGLRIADACHNVWRVNGLISEGRHWFDRLLDQDSEPSIARAHALASAIHFALLQNDLTAANRMLPESRQLAAEFGDNIDARCYKVPEAFAALQQHDFSSAIALGEEISVHSDDRDWGITAKILLGNSYSMQGDDERAMAQWQELLHLCEEHGERWRRAYAMWGLGVEAWRRGDWSRARSLELECLAVQGEFQFHDQYCTALSLETLSWIAASTGQYKEAARLAGAARAVRTEFGGTLLPFYDEYQERCQQEVRRSLGEHAYTKAFTEGTRLSLGDLAEELLGQTTTQTAATRNEPIKGLTKREREVAALVAQGMSNKQIARALVISQRTAEAHVENILIKLGFASRSQIAATVAETRNPHSPPQP
ncbi:ATP-binding protein [Saccharopolyspora shandongensis]|uniref:ATP-binding protein n=1 Tax=Saccharopolyspora shandongensis TaxID=418495 RepID=UPI0033F47211